MSGPEVWHLYEGYSETTVENIDEKPNQIEKLNLAYCPNRVCNKLHRFSSDLHHFQPNLEVATLTKLNSTCFTMSSVQ